MSQVSVQYKFSTKTKSSKPSDRMRLQNKEFLQPQGYTSGERGIRTPGTSRYVGFQDRCIRPLCHLSSYDQKPLRRGSIFNRDGFGK